MVNLDFFNIHWKGICLASYFFGIIHLNYSPVISAWERFFPRLASHFSGLICIGLVSRGACEDGVSDLSVTSISFAPLVLSLADRRGVSKFGFRGPWSFIPLPLCRMILGWVLIIEDSRPSRGLFKDRHQNAQHPRWKPPPGPHSGDPALRKAHRLHSTPLGG